MTAESKSADTVSPDPKLFERLHLHALRHERTDPELAAARRSRK
jgi:hypothetical protein